jgi:general secretion pathway protein J
MTAIRLRRGFTLVEMLVSVALLALLTLGLVTAMRSFAQSETRVDSRLRIDDDLRVSERFLRTILAGATPRQRPTGAGAPAEVDFAGGADSLRWIGVMPARHGAGGLYRFHLHGRPVGGDGPAALMLEFFPYVPGFEAPLDGKAAQTRAMALGIGEVRFRYQDDPKSGEPWLTEWSNTERLPRRIGISVKAEVHPWPEVVVDLIAHSGQVRSGGVASGPSVGPR